MKKIFSQIENFGFQHKCNLCNSYIKKMLPTGETSVFFKNNHIIGGGYRENAVCPVCGSIDRERMVYYFLKKYTNILNEKCCVLHIAPEENLKKKIKKNLQCNYLSGDISPGKADYVVDLTNIQFDNEKFDYIICNHVFEHIPDEKMAISEMKRVLKKNGKIILTMPICLSNQYTIEEESESSRSERRNKFGQADHVRLFGRDIKEHLNSRGLKVKVYNFEKVEKLRELTKYCILKGDRLYFYKKI